MDEDKEQLQAIELYREEEVLNDAISIKIAKIIKLLPAQSPDQHHQLQAPSLFVLAMQQIPEFKTIPFPNTTENRGDIHTILRQLKALKDACSTILERLQTLNPTNSCAKHNRN